MTATIRTEDSRRFVQAMYDAGSRGDVEGLLSHLAQDVVVREPAFLPYGADYHGHQEFLSLFTKIGKVLDITKIQIDYLVADDDKVIGIIRIPDITTGQTILLAEESILRDGKIVEMRIFFHDAQSLIGQTRL
jgi:ketosteroid isomerase-like protein